MKVVRWTEMSDLGPVPGVSERAMGAGAGTTGVWLARITAEPGSGISPVHHHRESEAVVTVLSGTLTIFHGESCRERIELGPGDFLFIPPFTLHAEGNLGNEPADIVMARSTAEPIAEYHPELAVGALT